MPEKIYSHSVAGSTVTWFDDGFVEFDLVDGPDPDGYNESWEITLVKAFYETADFRDKWQKQYVSEHFQKQLGHVIYDFLLGVQHKRRISAETVRRAAALASTDWKYATGPSSMVFTERLSFLLMGVDSGECYSANEDHPLFFTQKCPDMEMNMEWWQDIQQRCLDLMGVTNERAWVALEPLQAEMQQVWLQDVFEAYP